MMNPTGMYEVGKERVKEKQKQSDAWRQAEMARNGDRDQGTGAGSSWFWLLIGSGVVAIMLGLAVIL